MTDFIKLTRRVAVLCACAAALMSAPADAAPRFGIAEDATKYADDGGSAFYERMKSLRMTVNRIAVRWNPLEPTEILEKKFLDRAVPVAEGSGIRTVFDVFAIDPLAFGINTETRATLFGAYLQKLARTYPEVTDFIIANEPNEAFFWRPQFGPGESRRRRPTSCASSRARTTPSRRSTRTFALSRPAFPERGTIARPPRRFASSTRSVMRTEAAAAARR